MPGKAEHIGTTSDGRQVVRALCSVSPSASGEPEQKIHIFPFGPVVVTRDERMYQVKDLASVVTASELPALIDWEHDSERWDGSTEAAGWVTSLEVSDGNDGRASGLWGTVEWTTKGKADIQSRAYRYLSPVLLIDPESRALTAITSIALTNKPALRGMTEISKFRERLSAQYGLQSADREETGMNPEKRKALVATFSLADNASDDDILAAAKSTGVKELLSQTTAQLATATAEVATAKTRVSELETQLAAAKADAGKATFESDVNACFEANKTKLSPAMVVGFRATLTSAESLAAFKAHVLPNLPPIGDVAPPSIVDTKSKSDGSVSAQERAALRARGMTDEQITKSAEFVATRRAQFTATEEG
jgi:phage I-like protein